MAKKTPVSIEDEVIEEVIEEIIEPITRVSVEEFAEQRGYKPAVVKAIKTLSPSYGEILSHKEWKEIFEAWMVKPVSTKWNDWLNEFKNRRTENGY